MRVVFLTHNYPRAPGDVAGAFLHPLALALAARNHDVRVVAPSDHGVGGSSRLDGIPVDRVRYASPDRERYAYSGRMQEALRSPAGWLAMLRLVSALRRGAEAAAGDDCQTVIHAHWWFPAGLAAPDRPCVVTLHGTDAALLARPGATWLARRALRRGRVVTAVSTHVGGQIERATRRTIDAGHRSPMPLTLPARRSAGGAGLVFVGRLTRQTRVDLALRGHALCVAAGHRLDFLVIGDGPERPALAALAESLGTGLVRFAGQVAPAQVGAAIGDADVFVFPALGEGLGLAAIEALGCGVPVVACGDGGGVLDIVPAGMAVAPTPEALAAGIAAVLADPGARRRAAEAGDRYRIELSPDSVAARCEDWYREALDG